MPAAQPPGQQPTRSVIPLLLAFSVCAVILAVLTALTPWLVLVVFVLFVIVALQYFLWGWWLGHVIREESEPETDQGSEGS